jgi:hypothetical protein
MKNLFKFLFSSLFIIILLNSAAAYATCNGTNKYYKCFYTENGEALDESNPPLCHQENGSSPKSLEQLQTIARNSYNAGLTPLYWYVDNTQECPTVHPPSDPTVSLVSYSDDVYVCEVGFNTELSNVGIGGRKWLGDHIIVTDFNNTKTRLTPGPGETNNIVFNSAQEAAGLTTDIYLNSLHTGAAYYIKYCFEYNNNYNGANGGSTITQMDISGNITLDVGNSGGYHTFAETTGTVTGNCSNENIPYELFDGGETLDFQAVTQESLYFQNIPLDVNIKTNFSKNCEVTILIEEQNKGSIREFKEDGTAYSGTVGTGFEYNVYFTYL